MTTIDEARPTTSDNQTRVAEDDAAALRRQREQLALAEQMAGVGHWRIDLVAGTLFWSDEIYRIHGVTPESYRPELESAIDFYHPADVEKVRSAVEQAISNKVPFEFEFRIVRPDGEVRTVRSRARVGLNRNGEVTSVFGIFQDVTEQRHAEQELRESKERYDLAVRGSTVGLWDWDLRESSLYWSPRFMEIVGVDEGDFVPRLSEFEDRLHPSDHDRVMSEVSAHLEDGVPYDTVYRLRREDGRYVWIHARGQAVWNEEGKPTRMAGSVADISERKRDEMMRNLISQLLSSREMDSGAKLQELLRIGIDYFDLDVGVIGRVRNDRYMAEFVDDTSGELVAGALLPLEDMYCAETVEARDVVVNNHVGVSPSRERRCYRVFGYEAYVGLPLRVNGEFYGVLELQGKTPRAQPLHPRELSFLRLVGQWIEYELGARETVDALLQAKHDLEQRAAELERSNRDLDQFAYIASHDLRAPMRGLDNLATWIEEDLAGKATKDIQEKLHLMRSRIGRMDRMLEDVLAYARAGKKETEPELVALVPLLHDIVDWAELPAGFKVVIEDPMPTLSVSRTAIEQVLSNLITNAAKHHDRKEGSVVVACESLDDTLVLSVTDDGPGIPEEFHERVLTMFQKLERRDQVEGSGIGLAIVQKIVNLLGGRLQIESPIENDRGTRFRIELHERLIAS